MPLPSQTEAISKAWSNTALPALLGALKGGRTVDVPAGYILTPFHQAWTFAAGNDLCV